MSSVGEVLRSAYTELGSMPEARWIVLRATGVGSSTGTLFTHLEDDASERLESSVVEMVARRRSGEPLQYVLGNWEFRELDVLVDGRALIPRPETEEVVARALAELSVFLRDERCDDRVVVVDLGTGSGVISLSLALEGTALSQALEGSSGDSPERSPLEIWATDASAEAITLARENLDLLVNDRPSLASSVRFAEGEWFEAVPSHLEGHVHLIVSNPPYVSESEWEMLDPVVRDHEPRRALVAGATGREVLDMLVSAAPRWLVPGGSCVLELAPDQADAVACRAASEGLVNVEVEADMSGRPRVLVAHKPR